MGSVPADPDFPSKHMFFCEIMAYHELFCMVKANYWEAQCNTTMTENEKINKTKLLMCSTVFGMFL